MSEVQEITAEEKPCRDPDCPGIAEPEIDGEHRFWWCTICGFEFDYEIVSDLQTGDSCQAGISEGVRRAFAETPGVAANPASVSDPNARPLFQIGRKPS